ncbi:MAG TPA: hypothetical protein VK154_08905 [Chitinophagales bacterium]|nr:hypothetical protein [Chitinophagales bacterium]
MKSFLFSVLLVIAFAISGCKPGCKDVSCLNDGECIAGGTCQCEGQWGGMYCDSLCPQGYEGIYCNIPSRNKFIRTWNATTSSPSTGMKEHSLFVTTGPIVQQILITNFNDEHFTVVGTITGKSKFDIMSQNATGNFTGVVVGSGYLNGDNMAINLTKGGVDYFANCNR